MSTAKHPHVDYVQTNQTTGLCPTKPQHTQDVHNTHKMSTTGPNDAHHRPHPQPPTIISKTAGPQWFVKYLTAYVLSQFIYDPVLVRLKLNVVALSSLFLLLMSLFFNDDPYISTYVFTSSKELDPITNFKAWLRI